MFLPFLFLFQHSYVMFLSLFLFIAPFSQHSCEMFPFSLFHFYKMFLPIIFLSLHSFHIFHSFHFLSLYSHHMFLPALFLSLHLYKIFLSFHFLSVHYNQIFLPVLFLPLRSYHMFLSLPFFPYYHTFITLLVLSLHSYHMFLSVLFLSLHSYLVFPCVLFLFLHSYHMYVSSFTISFPTFSLSFPPKHKINNKQQKSIGTNYLMLHRSQEISASSIAQSKDTRFWTEFLMVMSQRLKLGPTKERTDIWFGNSKKTSQFISADNFLLIY